MLVRRGRVAVRLRELRGVGWPSVGPEHDRKSQHESVHVGIAVHPEGSAVQGGEGSREREADSRAGYHVFSVPVLDEWLEYLFPHVGGHCGAVVHDRDAKAGECVVDGQGQPGVGSGVFQRVGQEVANDLGDRLRVDRRDQFFGREVE